jgi:hypothetical protein
MLISMEPLTAETVALLRAPMKMPPGMGFQPISLESALGESAGHRLVATLALDESARSAAVATWLWERVGEEAPLLVAVAGTKARVGEAAAIAWLIDRGRGAA